MPSALYEARGIARVNGKGQFSCMNHALLKQSGAHIMQCTLSWQVLHFSHFLGKPRQSVALVLLVEQFAWP